LLILSFFGLWHLRRVASDVEVFPGIIQREKVEAAS